ncbi:MAG: OmpH family outer membrane protein [Candidatus Cloacimonetes bacterium]|nr:OmpH family outer membrane protein [Candidatus Cloacimonadota bacterium]
MKRYYLILLCLSLALGVFAQSTKLGYVDTDRILYDSNEAAEIGRLYQLDRQNWSNQIRALDDEIKQMERDYEIRRLSVNEATKKELQNLINTKKAEAGRLLEEYFGENGRAQQRYHELIDPLTQRVQDIITKIAKDENYTMIFDTSFGLILYTNPAIDITEQVLQELNKDTIKPTDEGLLPDFKPEQPKNPLEGFGDFKEGEFK